jgi:hypothetical protein
VLDGGSAMHAACQHVTPTLPLQHDQWHVLHACAQRHARMKRQLATLLEGTAVVERQAARVAAGEKPKGRAPQTDVAAHAAQVVAATRVVEQVAYLLQEVHRLLEVVVLDHQGLVDGLRRQGELETAVALLAEVAATSPAPFHVEAQRVQTMLREALPTLVQFVGPVMRVQQDLTAVLAPARQALLGWAWLRRKALGWSERDVVAAVPAAWQAGARVLLATWEAANRDRVSSAVERWHSILRPHLAVHRTLSSGRLALLAVWHNHRVFRRGKHKGKSPLHLSGMVDAPTDWLVALGYPPTDAGVVRQQPGLVASARALAA